MRFFRNKIDILIGLTLILFILAVYGQVRDFKFVYYDDAAYVIEMVHVMNGLTWEGFKWAMSATEAGFWHPLTWLSLMIDRELFGSYAGGYHWTNVILHMINTLLLYLLLRESTAAPFKSAMVAILFAIHPLHVESVAWASQRKDLLCTVFGFASLLAYVRYARHPSFGRYGWVSVFFILGIMSKPMIVTFPFVMLLMDFWPLQRLAFRPVSANGAIHSTGAGFTNRQSFRMLLREKIPLILLSVLASVAVILTEQKVQALTSLKVLSIADRLSNAVISYVKYVVMMFWPVNLTFFYPHPITPPGYQVLGALLLVLAVTIVAILFYRRRPYLCAGWFWYAGTLIPVIGLIQVGPHAMADRYTYVPLIGLFIIVVWGVSDLVLSWRGRFGKPLLWTISAITITVLSVSCWLQASYWRNSVTLFEHALKIAPDNYIALNNLGQFYVNNGEYDKGLAYMHQATQIKPNFGTLYFNVGLALHSRKDFNKAIAYFEKAEELSFVSDENLRLLGDCYWLTGKRLPALNAYKRALKANGRNIVAKFGFALALAANGQDDDAMRELKEVLLSDPLHVSARKQLMFLYLKRGDGSAAVAEGQKAIANGTADSEVRRIMDVAEGKK